MAPTLVQSTFNSVAKYQTRTCTATFSTPTTPGNLLVVVCLAAGTLPSRLTTPAGFTPLADGGLRDIQMSVWYQPAAAATSSVSVTALDDNKSLQVRVLEYSGVAQSSVVDKVLFRTSESDSVFTGTTATTVQADQLVLGFIGNQYASTVQYGFLGGLTKLFETVSPQYYGFYGSNQDFERGRLTVQQGVAAAVGQFFLGAGLSTTRRWLACLVTFKGGSLGPARFTSVNAPPVMVTGGGGSLTAFGPLTSRNAPPVLVTGGGGQVLPFNFQYRLLNGVLLTANPEDGPYRVKSVDGLYGNTVRTSDDDQPRGDGALRGIDLQSARLVTFDLEIADDPDGLERRLDVLRRALVPQRDTDWPMVWRHPGQPARLIYCRPIDVPAVLNQETSIRSAPTITLRAADPRHYGATAKRVTVPVTPAGQAVPNTVNVTNEGDIAAYPLITITGPTSGPPVTKVSLVNQTSLVSFDVILTLAKGSVLVGDMQARSTGAPRSAVTLDGQAKYGSWQLPRIPFRLDADPTGQLGYNVLRLETTPAGAPVTCSLDFRDTWSG